jgi:hypothetical protein
MVYKSSDLAIIIPSKNYQNINICLNSIKDQTKKPGQTIVIFDKKKNFKNTKKILFSHTKIANQVLQRNHGLRMINKKIKLILQLDDKFYLHKRAIENLINEWNNVNENVAGIGIKSNLKDLKRRKYFNFLKYLMLTWSNEPGKVLINGFNNQPLSKKKSMDVDWLQGGLSSWRLKHVPHIFNRKFPLNKWSVLEDLIFSFNVKFKKNFRLVMCSGLKAYVIKKSKEKYEMNEYYYRGYEYARMHKVFVYINKKELSKFVFFYSYISSSLLGILWGSLKFDKKLFFYLGRLRGICANIKKIKVL